MEHEHLGQPPNVELLAGGLVLLAARTEPEILLPEVLLAEELLQTVLDRQFRHLLVAINLRLHQLSLAVPHAIRRPLDDDVLIGCQREG